MLSNKEIFKITWWPVLTASLCCLAPVGLVLLSLSTAAFAASLADVLYGQYKWWFRLAGVLLLTASLVLYLRRQRGICTLDQARQQQREVVNLALVVFCAGVLGYILWLYVAVELVGYWLGIWG